MSVKGLREIYLEPPHSGYEKDGGSDKWSVWSDDFPEPELEGSREDCATYIAAEVLAGRAAITQDGEI